MRTVLLLSLLLVLCACGQKGALIAPAEPAAVAPHVEADADTEADADAEADDDDDEARDRRRRGG